MEVRSVNLRDMEKLWLREESQARDKVALGAGERLPNAFKCLVNCLLPHRPHNLNDV